MSKVSDRLTAHALSLEWAAMDTASRRALLNFLHDSLAVGVAGRNGANADAMMTLAASWGDGGEVPVLGRPGVRVPAASAAFLNGFQIHCQEFDCVHEPAVLHPMATILSACLAEAARSGPVSGTDFLSGLAAGVDIATGLGLAAGPVWFFRPATAGIFGCVMAIARMTQMNPAQARDALGHALSFSSGTMQPHVEGKPALPIQIGNAARGAIVAIDLARAGISGVEHPIEGPFGYFQLLEKQGDPDALLSGLGTPGERIAQVSWKPFPTGRAGHGGIVAMQQLARGHGFGGDDLAQFTYLAPPLIERLVGRPAIPGMAAGYARLCLPWLAAVTLVHGKVSLEHFTRDYLEDPALLEIAAKVRVISDGNPDPAAFAPALATAHLHDGRELIHRIDAQLGSPQLPLTRAQHLEKARDCLAFGGLADCADRLSDRVENIAAASDVMAELKAAGIFG